jgi:peptidoglycan/xylan/chitin deacetylase (PgdA/CDA1 family)
MSAGAIDFLLRAAAQTHLSLRGERDALMSLTFHGLLPDSAAAERNLVDPSYAVTREDLRFLIEHYLENGYAFISPDSLGEGLSGSGRFVQMTFDDGYRNNLDAVPILEEFDVPATFFITSKNVEEGRSFWWDVVYRSTVGKGRSPREFHTRMGELIWQPVESTEATLLEECGDAAFTPVSDLDRPMTETELRELAAHPLVSIGNHTKGHGVLTCYDEAGIRDQIGVCQRYLTGVIGAEPETISYPCGQYNDLVIRVVSEFGFRYGFSTEERKTPTPVESSGQLTLGRFVMQSSKSTRDQCISHRSEIYDLLSRAERRLSRLAET